MKNLLLLLLVITFLLSNCTNKEKVLQKAKSQAALDSIKKSVEEENQRLARLKDVLSIRKNSIDYDEPFTIYFGRKKVYAEEGDLKGFISVSVGISNEGSFLQLGNEGNFLRFLYLLVLV